MVLRGLAKGFRVSPQGCGPPPGRGTAGAGRAVSRASAGAFGQPRVRVRSSRAGPVGRWPVGQTARRSRWRETPSTGMLTRRRIDSSSPTASSLSTEGPAPLTAGGLHRRGGGEFDQRAGQAAERRVQDLAGAGAALAQDERRRGQLGRRQGPPTAGPGVARRGDDDQPVVRDDRRVQAGRHGQPLHETHVRLTGQQQFRDLRRVAREQRHGRVGPLGAARAASRAAGTRRWSCSPPP